MRVDGAELSGFGREALHTTTQGSHPDVAPLILGNRPDIIVEQLAIGIGHGVVLGLSVGKVNKSAIVGTKPYRAILGTTAGYHHIAGKAAARLIVHLDLASGRQVFDDTTVVGTKPPVAGSIHTGGVHVAHLQGIEAQEFLDILVQAVAIAANPHVARAVEHQLFRSVLADRGGVVLVMDEVLDLTTLHVDDKDTHVVGSQPHPTALVHAHIPHLETCWQRGYAILCQIIVEMGVPFLILLVVHKHMAHVQHPVVAMLIHIAVIGLTRLSAIQLHKVVALDNLALLAIDNHQVAIG